MKKEEHIITIYIYVEADKEYEVKDKIIGMLQKSDITDFSGITGWEVLPD